ncbi:MAG: formate dehydrogenase accessory sulfurtransferase FdhD [Thermodesulfovibrionales bacterium]|nr:formate dehydrogenase accessory sulfurtransferase FdhD [Thermodesulfovibrionales bacterium]
MFTDTITKEITKIEGKNSQRINDIIALEKRIRIAVNGSEVMSLYCTPIMVKELVVGIFMTEGIIQGSWCADRINIKYEEDVVVDIPADGKVTTDDAVITSGCIGGITFPKRLKIQRATDNYSIDAQKLCNLFRVFQDASTLYKSTGCVHSAAISDGEEILCLAEDIGRHNAVDKIIGYALLEGISFDNKIMLASGRLSSEIVAKCAKWQIPIVASRTSPTSLAVEIAESANVTVAGFVRGRRLNVYTAPQRIINPQD